MPELNATTAQRPAATIPVMYAVRGAVIPPRLTLQQRFTYVTGLGVGNANAIFLATQDHAASAITLLQTLIERHGDAKLQAEANKVVERWNKEVQAFIER